MPSDPRDPPFEAFNFVVEITVPGIGGQVCHGAFSECDGLEATLEVKTFRQGGAPASQVRLVTGAGYGQVTLRRGLTSDLHPWEWLSAVTRDPSLRAEGEVTLLAPDGTERVRYLLTRCVPVKVKAPALNARDGGVAIEELGIVCERIEAVSGAGGLLGLQGGLGVA